MFELTNFNTICNNKQALIEIKKSNFYGYCFKVNSIQEINDIIDDIKSNNKKAKHVCFAYSVINNDQLNIKFDDDNEPNRTAGFMILDVLNKQQITNTLIVVVRYFGGIKLGVGLLSRTYSNCALLTIKDNIKQLNRFYYYQLNTNYIELSSNLKWLNNNNCFIVNKQNGEDNCLIEFKSLNLLNNNNFRFITCKYE